jgi:hypothetical protein
LAKPGKSVLAHLIYVKTTKIACGEGSNDYIVKVATTVEENL